MTAPKTRVLFVCMGNICRSPSGEAVLRRLVREQGLEERFEIDSAGTIGYHVGEPADPRMRRHGARRGYDLDSISRQVRRRDFDDFDLILAMDRDNLRDLQSLARDEAQREKIRLFCSYLPEEGVEDVPDPYFGGDEGFERVLDLIERGCERLIEAHRDGHPPQG